jgi:hypothetical protein
MQTFIVECYWPGMSADGARNTLDRVTRLAAGMSAARSTQPLGCLLVPSDGMALFLFSAPSEDAVRRVGALAEVPFDRIVELVLVGFGTQRAGSLQIPASDLRDRRPSVRRGIPQANF